MIANIIVVWGSSRGVIAILATVLELAFAGITIGIYFAQVNLFCMYGNFILFTGKNLSDTETVTLIFDVMAKKLLPFEEYEKKMGDYL